MALAWPFPAPRRRPIARPAATVPVPDPVVAPLPAPPWGGWGAPCEGRDPPALARPGRPGPPGPRRRAAAGPGPARGRRALGGRHPLLLLSPAVHRRRAPSRRGACPSGSRASSGATPSSPTARRGCSTPRTCWPCASSRPRRRWWPCAWRASTSPGPSPTPSCAPPGPGAPGALVAGLGFMLSGFMVAQVVHENLDGGMIWLPLALCFVERAVRAPGPRRAGRLRPPWPRSPGWPWRCRPWRSTSRCASSPP